MYFVIKGSCWPLCAYSTLRESLLWTHRDTQEPRTSALGRPSGRVKMSAVSFSSPPLSPKTTDLEDFMHYRKAFKKQKTTQA